MVLKLFGKSVAGVVRLVACILCEKKVPYEFVHIDFSKNEHKSAEHLEKQPFGQVPYIVRDVLYAITPPLNLLSALVQFIFSSRMMMVSYSTKPCYYIAAKYPNQGTPLPTELKANALFQQAASSEIFQIYFFRLRVPFMEVVLISRRCSGVLLRVP
jgi:glutathione S-transferase